MDLSGRLSPGINQEQKQWYLLVGVYTFPVTKEGNPLVDVDGLDLHDHPLPDLEEIPGEEAVHAEGEEPPDPDPLQ